MFSRCRRVETTSTFSTRPTENSTVIIMDVAAQVRSDPIPQVERRVDLRLVGLSVSGGFVGWWQAEGPGVASGGGVLVCLGAVAWAGRCGERAEAGEDLFG